VRKLAGLVYLATALWAGAAAAQVAEQLVVPVEWQGRQIQLRADLQKPLGAGPFPAVIALHGCGGYNTMGSRWTNWFLLLWQQGYATLLIDSFTARGHYGGVCNNKSEVTGVESATYALAAAYLLAGRPDIRRDHIAVMGWSHGGRSAALVTEDRPDQRSAREKLASRGGKLAASVDFYGPCVDFTDGDAKYPVVVPLLVLVGSADERGATCLELAKAQPPLLTLQAYPGAHHDFDAPGGGGFDAAATADAHARVTAFLRRYMQ
jgi:dienelactone hydrolase